MTDQELEREILDYIEFHCAATSETKRLGLLDFTDFVSFICGSVESQGSRPLESPAVVEWEVTGKCNFRCEYCYFRAIPRRSWNPELNTREALAAITEMRESNVLAVRVEGGEPFTRPDLPELLAALKRYRIGVYLATNGSLVSTSVARRLARVLDPATDHVQVSLDGDCAAVHDSIAGTPCYDRVLRGMLALSEAGIRLMAGMVVVDSNLAAVPGTYRLVRQIPGVEKFNISPALAVADYAGYPAARKHLLLRVFNQLHRIRLEEGGPLVDARIGHAFHLEAYRRRMVELGGMRTETPYDRAGRSVIAIAPNGDVYPDHHLMFPELRMGNVRTSTLGAIWKSTNWEAVRNGRSPSAECRSCGMRRLCSQRSMPLAYSRYRAFDAKDPNCIYVDLA